MCNCGIWSFCLSIYFVVISGNFFLQFQYVTSMSIEVHVRTRLGLRPDPEWDPVLVVFYDIQNDWEPGHKRTGLIAIDLTHSKNLGTPVKRKVKSPSKRSPKPSPRKQPQKAKAPRLVPASPLKNFTGLSATPATRVTNNLPAMTADDNSCREFLEHCGLSPNLNITYVQREADLFHELVKLVRQVDPDFLIGYETEMSSLGYLNDRAAFLGINLLGQLARIPSSSQKRAPPTSENLSWRVTELHVGGRIVLNLWRIIKYEVSTNNNQMIIYCI